MPDLSAAQRRKLQALRRAYRAELPEKVSAIALAAALLRQHDWDTAGLNDLHHVVHRLAGSSAIWGFMDVSKTAGELEEVVLSGLETSGKKTVDIDREVGRLVQELQEAVRKSAEAPSRRSGPRTRPSE